jgi:hypothetical protein
VRYERPRIIRRERIDAMLQTLSEVQRSDVNLKENIAPIAW